MTAIAWDYVLGLTCPDCGHVGTRTTVAGAELVIECERCSRPHGFTSRPDTPIVPARTGARAVERDEPREGR